MAYIKQSISNDESGLERQVQIDKLIITDNYIEIIGAITHQQTKANKTKVLQKFDIPIQRNTVNTYIDAVTQEYLVKDADGNFPKGSTPIAEIDALKSTQQWAGVVALVSQVLSKMDAAGKFDLVKNK